MKSDSSKNAFEKSPNNLGHKGEELTAKLPSLSEIK